MRTVLFLCTGNYYRSRFAEEFFNHEVLRRGLAWTAQSRALAIERGIDNVGPLSPFALAALKERGVAVRGANRFPLPCTAHDLLAADLIVAMSELEHRPLMRDRFPEWESRAQYWLVEDIGITPVHVALNTIAERIERLLGGMV